MQKYLVNSKKSSTFAPAFEKKTTGAVVQLVRIPACHAVGREFESRPHRKPAEMRAFLLLYVQIYPKFTQIVFIRSSFFGMPNAHYRWQDR